MKNYDIEAIAKGKVTVDTSAMAPMDALRLGLEVQDYKDANGIDDSVKIDYNAVGEILSNGQKK